MDEIKIEQSLQVRQKQWDEIFNDIAYTEIASAEECLEAANLLKETKRAYKEIEAQRVELTKPLNDTIKKLNNLFKPTQNLIKKVEAALKQCIGDYELRQKEAQRRLLQQAVDSRDREMLQKAKDTQAPKISGISVRSILKYRVVNENSIPDKYWTRVINYKLIDEELKNNGIKTDIPGIEVYEDAQVRASSD